MFTQGACLHEIELKFQVPMAGRAAVLRAVATATAQQVHLRARYYDTADRRLAAARVALRLRQEGPRWVQTLKAQGDGPMSRLEHEVMLPQRRAAPVLDPLRHVGTPAFDRLAVALGATSQDLQAALSAGQDLGLALCFETDIHRTRRLTRTGGARIELAWDQGWIRAGGRRLPVCELEMEWLSGPVDALTTLAARWVARHGLWLDTRSKAERGDLLSRGWPALPATRWAPPVLPPGAKAADALRPMLLSALAQVLANASVLADAVLLTRVGGQPLEGAEHLHQWRVGLRRVRSALRVFAAPSSTVDGPGPDPGCEATAAELCRRLGSARDADALALSVWPLLRAAGAPVLPSPQGLLHPEQPIDDPGELARGAAFNVWVLALLGWCHRDSADEIATSGSDQGAVEGPGDAAAHRAALRSQHRWLAQALDRAWRPVRRGARDFDQHSEEQRHRLRKRLRRLRYALECVQGGLPAKAVSRQLAALQAAQVALGLYNDLCLARRLFAAVAARDRASCWAEAWLARRAEQQSREAARHLRRLLREPLAWD